mmetsp:Transcript_38784/g.90416  ORF Transcript_38784/g.90416 Transcript_38784/m.90416 type:complete len:252 (+) Transcript_38784:302-1057(+)
MLVLQHLDPLSSPHENVCLYIEIQSKAAHHSRIRRHCKDDVGRVLGGELKGVWCGDISVPPEPGNREKVTLFHARPLLPDNSCPGYGKANLLVVLSKLVEDGPPLCPDGRLSSPYHPRVLLRKHHQARRLLLDKHEKLGVLEPGRGVLAVRGAHRIVQFKLFGRNDTRCVRDSLSPRVLEPKSPPRVWGLEDAADVECVELCEKVIGGHPKAACLKVAKVALFCDQLILAPPKLALGPPGPREVPLAPRVS